MFEQNTQTITAPIIPRPLSICCFQLSLRKSPKSILCT